MTAPSESERRFDAELLTRIGAGDEAAFTQLYDRFAPGLYSLILRMVRDVTEAEDVLQEGFAHVWRRASSYDPARSSAFTWAVMVFRNKAIDRMRIRQRRDRAVDRASENPLHFPLQDDRSAEVPALRERQAQVRTALAEIPEEQRLAVDLAFFGGFTHEQIAEKLGTPLGTIKARIRRGLLRLRESLEDLA